MPLKCQIAEKFNYPLKLPKSLFVTNGDIFVLPPFLDLINLFTEFMHDHVTVWFTIQAMYRGHQCRQYVSLELKEKVYF